MMRKDEFLFSSESVWKRERERKRRPSAGTWREPARDVPIYRKTDVLVVGGGPAGTAAAIAAARMGADVTLVERYNHLGGLSTGGLVIWIDRMTDWNGEQLIRGIASDLLERLPADAKAGPAAPLWGSRNPEAAAYWSQRTAAFHATVTWSPTIDPEWLKLVSLSMVLEARVNLMLHCWAVAPMVEEKRICGAVFESKEGRRAVAAAVVVDASGDGDLYAGAGASFESDIEEDDIHHCMNVAWLFGGVDMERWIAFKTLQQESFADFMQRGREALKLFERPYVSWRNDVALFLGPRLAGYSPLNVEDLTAVEIESRRLMVEHLGFYRAHAPGFEQAYLMLSAPQMGVRHSRRLLGVHKVAREQWEGGAVFDDEIGVSPSPSPVFPSISIPYRSLLPAELDGVLAAGRHVACDRQSHSFLREIPQCWITGQAAGVAAALAADRGRRPRDLDPRDIQRQLLKQGAYLRQRHDERASAGGRGA